MILPTYQVAQFLIPIIAISDAATVTKNSIDSGVSMTCAPWEKSLV